MPTRWATKGTVTIMKIGIDLGGTTVSMGVVDDNYKIVAEAEFPTADCKTPKELSDIVINGTKKLLEENKTFSIAFLDKSRRDAYAVCGKESGADTDKLTKCGLSTEELDGIDVISEAETALTCKVLYEDDLKECGFLDSSLLSNYATAGYHRMFVCEIIGAYKKS